MDWYHFVAIAILHQPRPTDSADINTQLQLSDTSSIPPMHGGFLLASLDMMRSAVVKAAKSSFILPCIEYIHIDRRVVNRNAISTSYSFI